MTSQFRLDPPTFREVPKVVQEARERFLARRKAQEDGACLPFIRTGHDPLLGPVMVAFAENEEGEPLIARVLGWKQGARYDLAPVSTWLTCDAMNGFGLSLGCDGAAVAPVERLVPMDCLFIRCGLLRAPSVGYHLWVPAVGVEPLTEYELRQALASPWRRRAPMLTGRAIDLALGRL